MKHVLTLLLPLIVIAIPGEAFARGIWSCSSSPPKILDSDFSDSLQPGDVVKFVNIYSSFGNVSSLYGCNRRAYRWSTIVRSANELDEMDEQELSEYTPYEEILREGEAMPDEYCNSTFGGTGSWTTSETSFTTSSGACQVTLVGVGISTTDEDGLTEWSGEWVGTSTGEPFEAPRNGERWEPIGAMSEYLTENESCINNCITVDNRTYEIDQDAIDSDTTTFIDVSTGEPFTPGGGDSGSSGGGSDDGSSGDGSSGDGSSGGSSSGGSSSGGGSYSGGPSSSDGFDDSGIIGAINGLKTAMQNGFDNVVDDLSHHFSDSLNEFGEKLTDTEGMPTEEETVVMFGGEGSASEVMKNLNNQYNETNSGLIDQYEDVFENDGGILGSAISSMESFATSFLPEVPIGDCAPIHFNSDSASFTIDCEVFNLIKASLSWILFFFTAYEITSIALNYRSS